MTEPRPQPAPARAPENDGARFAALLAHTTDVLVEVRSGRITYVSPNSPGVLGLRPEEMVGRTPAELIHPDDLPHLAPFFAEGWTGRIDATFRVANAHGEWEWREARGVREGDTDGSPHSLLILRDITGRKHAEEIVSRFSTMIAHSRDVLLEMRDGLISYVSPNAKEVLGMTPEEMIGRGADAFVHPDDLLALARYYADGWQGEVGVDIRVDVPGRGWRWFEAKGRREVSQSGTPGSVNVLRDVTERKSAEDALRANEERFRSLSASSPVGIFETDIEGRCKYANERWLQIAGMTLERALGDGWADAIHPDDAHAVFTGWGDAVRDERDFAMEFRFQRPNSTFSWVQSRASAIKSSSGDITGYVGTVADITEARVADEQLRDSEELHRTVISAMGEGVIIRDADGVITGCNAAAEQILERSADDLLWSTDSVVGWDAFREDGAHFPESERPSLLTLRTGQPMYDVIIGMPKDDRTLWLSLTTQPLVRAGEHRPYAVVTSFADISVKKQQEDDLVRHAHELERLNTTLAASQHELADKSQQLEQALAAEREVARRDALTGAFNHGAIIEAAMQLASADASTDAGRFAVAMIDVDGMKTANDTYGHQAGDLVLKRVTAAAERDGAVIGRYGGDEFLVLLPGADRAAAEAYRQAIALHLRGAHIIDPGSGARVPVIASVGVAAFPVDALDLTALIEYADEAMYEEKLQRRAAASLQGGARTADDERIALVIGELVPLVTQDSTLEEKLRVTAHRLAMRLGYAAVNIDFFAADHAPVAAQNSFVRAPDDLIEAWVEEQRLGGDKPIGEFLEMTRQPIVLDNLSADERLTETQRRLLTAAGMRSGVAVPMIAGGQMVGVLAAARTELAAFTAADASLLAQITATLTALLEMIVRASVNVETRRAA